MEILVTIYLYSGIRNPSWVVTGAEGERIVDALHQLPETPCPAEKPPGRLGYAGFRFEFRQDGTAEDGEVRGGMVFLGKTCRRDGNAGSRDCSSIPHNRSSTTRSDAASPMRSPGAECR